MLFQRIAIAGMFAVGLAAAPLSAADAQGYYSWCNPFPLSWPFCIVGAAANSAAALVNAPFHGLYPFYWTAPTNPYPPPPPDVYQQYSGGPYYYGAR